MLGCLPQRCWGYIYQHTTTLASTKFGIWLNSSHVVLVVVSDLNFQRHRYACIKFSLAIFKFGNLQRLNPHQTFPLYSTMWRLTID